MADKDSSPRDPFQKYLDAGIAFTNLTRARAEKLVSELVQSGEFRGDARARVDELIERSRKSQETLFTQVRQEVDRQLEHLGINNLDDLAKQVAALLSRTAEAGRAATGGGPKKKRSPAKKASGKKSATTKSAAKKVPAKKKAAAKKSPAKTAAATKTARTAKTATKKSVATKTARKPAAGRASGAGTPA